LVIKGVIRIEARKYGFFEGGWFLADRTLKGVGRSAFGSVANAFEVLRHPKRPGFSKVLRTERSGELSSFECPVFSSPFPKANRVQIASDLNPVCFGEKQ
jgi:hypothetical protein